MKMYFGHKLYKTQLICIFAASAAEKLENLFKRNEAALAASLHLIITISLLAITDGLFWSRQGFAKEHA